MRVALLTAVAMLSLACGAAAGGPPSPSPSPSAPAQLTVADSGSTVHLHVGDRVEVALQRASGFSDWSHPTATDQRVLVPVVDTHAASALGVTIAAFKAVAAGSSDLQSASGAVCSPGTACPAIARAWQVHVVVS